MREEKILSSIKKSIDDAPINLLDKIKSQDIPKMLRHDEITKQKDARTLSKTLFPIMSLAASLLFVFGIWQFNQNIPDSYVYLDVNPSVEIVTNKKDHVIKLLSFNEDGEKLIEDVNYKGRDMVLVTEEIVKKMISEGYISNSEDYLLISVFNKDQDKKQEQKDSLNASIHSFMEEEEFMPIILLQNIENTSTIERYAKDFGVSPSKMTFIRNMIILNPELQVEDLVSLSLKELVLIGRTMELNLESIIQSDDFDRIPEVKPVEDFIDDDDKDDDDDRNDDDDNDDKDDDDDNDDNEDKENDDNDDDDDDDDDVINDTGDMPADRKIISRDEAIRIAVSLTGGGTVTSVDLDQDDHEAEYEVEIAKDGKVYEIEIDGYTGKVLDFDMDEED